VKLIHDGVAVHAIGYTINFEFDRLNETDARNYTIIAYNSHGRSTFDFEIIPAYVGTFYFVVCWKHGHLLGRWIPIQVEY
jgi:hypothetical protein